MPSFSFDNKTYTIPDAYGTIKVSNQVGAIPPEFNIALIIGKGDRGQPYDVVTTSPVQLFEKQNDVNDEYGSSSDIAKAFEYFKKHGGRKAYCLNASDATKGTGELQDSVPGSVIDLTAANWGSYSAGINIKVENETTYVVITISDPDDSGIQIVSPQITTLDACVTWINAYASKYFSAVKHEAASNLPDDFDGAFSTTSNYSAGTNPAPTATDYDNIIAALPQWIEENDIRLICPVVNESGSNQHAIYLAFRDLAVTQRNNGKPIQLIVGGLTGDISLSAGDTTDLTFRSAAYNSQDMILVAPGIDSLDPYKTSAPAVLGMLNGNAIAHNLTRDAVVASTLETKFTDTNLESLITAGVLTFTYNKSGFYVCKGVNTMQDNDETWNVSSKSTPLPMQRAIADYILKYFREDLENTFIGADGVTKNKIVERCARDWDTIYKSFDPSLFGDISADPLGNGLPYKTDEITATTEGWYVYLSFVPANETNYIGLTVTVIVDYS